MVLVHPKNFFAPIASNKKNQLKKILQFIVFFQGLSTFIKRLNFLIKTTFIITSV